MIARNGSKILTLGMLCLMLPLQAFTVKDQRTNRHKHHRRIKFGKFVSNLTTSARSVLTKNLADFSFLSVSYGKLAVFHLQNTSFNGTIFDPLRVFYFSTHLTTCQQ